MNLFKSVVISALLTFALVACDDTDAPADIKTVRLGVADQPSSALVHIALARGFFKEVGLNIQATHYPSGKLVLLNGFVTGQVDYFTTADVPFVDFCFKDASIV